MFSWLPKKRRKEDVQSVDIEVPSGSTNCVRPFEHYALSKIRELQTERDSINNELEKLNSSQPISNESEFNKYVQTLAKYISENTDVTMLYDWLYYEFKDWEKFMSHLMKSALISCSCEVDFAKLSCEVDEINKRNKRIAINNIKLEQIDKELQELKKNLNID